MLTMLLYSLRVPKLDGSSILALPNIVAPDCTIDQEDSVQVLIPGQLPLKLEEIFARRCVHIVISGRVIWLIELKHSNTR